MSCYTNQQVFDKTVNHLRKQKCKSQDSSRMCLYRMELGNKGKVLKCAVGCHIPKSEYNKELEGKTLYIAIKGSPVSVLYKLGYSADNINLLKDLQHVHDNFKPEQWEKKLKEVASAFGLVYNRV